MRTQTLINNRKFVIIINNKSKIMKVIALLSIVVLFGSCGNNKTVVSKKEKEVIILTEGISDKNGEVSVNMSKNSSLELNEDTIGEIYPVIESGDNIVIEYKYEEKAEEGIADGNYSETLHFIVPKNTTVLTLNDSNLSDVKLLYGKHCFCKGEAGYYQVKNGKLKIVKTDKDLFFEISFTIDETSTKLVQVSKYLEL